jgi:hypothetical protein
MSVSPNFLICGAQKAGTTSLYAYLKTHPEVFMPKTKEIHFFDLYYDRGLSWYLAQFRKKRAVEARAIGEASPSYMFFEDVPGRIHQQFPNMKLVFVLRNPVERAYAHYWHEVMLGYEKLSFREAISAEQERLTNGDTYEMRHFSYKERGKYITQIRRFLQYFPERNILVLLSGDLRRSTLETLARVCRFLEISDDTDLIKNAKRQYFKTRSPRNKKLHRMAIGVFGPGSIVATRILSPLTTRQGYPPMQQDMLRELNEYFQPYNEELDAFLENLNLSQRWKSSHGPGTS